MTVCIECGHMFKPKGGERTCSLGCRHKRLCRQARASDANRARYLPPPPPIERAVVLPFNPSNPFNTDEDRRICAAARSAQA